MSGSWAFVAAAWLVTFLAIGAYALWLHRALKADGPDRKDSK